jgi:hypothetical protein
MESFLKLLKFLAWYGIAVVTLFYLLTVAGLMIEVQHEALSSSARIFAVIGFFMVLAIWQVISLRDRMPRETVETLDGMAL